MISYKKLVVLVAIGLAIVASIAEAKDYVRGSRQPGDVQCGTTKLDIPIDYIARSICSCLGPITQIYGHDRYGKGGMVTIEEGGLGKNFVQFTLESYLDHPANFTFIFYAMEPAIVP